MIVQIIASVSKKAGQGSVCRLACLIVLTASVICLNDAAAQTNKKNDSPAGIFSNPQTRSKTQNARPKRKPVTKQTAAPKTAADEQNVQSNPAAENVQTPVRAGNASDVVEPVSAKTASVKTDDKEPLFRQVSDFIGDLKKEGYAKKHDFIAEKMNDDKSWFNTVNVERNKRYVLLALCDDSCPAMNLKVYDEAGKVILNHRERQSRPTIYFSPQRTGVYRFKTTVVSCYKEPCRASLSVYER